MVSSCDADCVGESWACVDGEVGVGVLVGEWGMEEVDDESLIGECSAGRFLCCIFGEGML